MTAAAWFMLTCFFSGSVFGFLLGRVVPRTGKGVHPWH
jgi:hypothetical protein